MNPDLVSVADGVFETSPSPRLIGGHCAACTRRFFPKPKVCPYCLGSVSPAPLSTEGVVYSFTVVRTKAPFGLPQPYAVGYVDLSPDRLRVFSLFDSEKIEMLAIGKPVSLRIGPVGVDRDNRPCLRYYFTPREG